MELYNTLAVGLFLVSITSLCGFLFLCVNCTKHSAGRSHSSFDMVRLPRNRTENPKSPVSHDCFGGNRQTGLNNLANQAVGTEVDQERDPPEQGDDDGHENYVNIGPDLENGSYIEVLPNESNDQDLGSYENLPSVTGADHTSENLEENEYENVCPN